MICAMKIEPEREFHETEPAFIKRLAKDAAEYYLLHYTKPDDATSAVNPALVEEIGEVLLVVLGDTANVSFMPEAWRAGVGFGPDANLDSDWIPAGGEIRWPAEPDVAACVRQLAILETVVRVLKRYFIEWLQDHEVTQVRIAEILGTTPQNVNKNYRTRSWQCQEVVRAALDEEQDLP